VTICLATGIDIIEIDRIEQAVMRWGDRFLQRIYTERELAICRGQGQRLAGRFATKEATSKALGVGIRTLRWRDIEVLRDPLGKPMIRLHGKAAAIAQAKGLDHFDVSITHSRSDALSVVVAWGEDAP
jgi:holo-[acyl-carrier protein] synthase